MKQSIIYLVLVASMLNAQVTGLSGWNLFVDPGHSITQNMGVNGYSEAEEVLQTAAVLSNGVEDLQTYLCLFIQYAIQKLPHLLGADIMHNLPLNTFDCKNWMS